MYFVINLIKDCKKKNPNKLKKLQIFETSLPVHEDNEENEVHMQNMLECPQFYRNYVNMWCRPPSLICKDEFDFNRVIELVGLNYLLLLIVMFIQNIIFISSINR
jgi:hypothetical protein